MSACGWVCVYWVTRCHIAGRLYFVKDRILIVMRAGGIRAARVPIKWTRSNTGNYATSMRTVVIESLRYSMSKYFEINLSLICVHLYYGICNKGEKIINMCENSECE